MALWRPVEVLGIAEYRVDFFQGASHGCTTTNNPWWSQSLGASYTGDDGRFSYFWDRSPDIPECTERLFEETEDNPDDWIYPDIWNVNPFILGGRAAAGDFWDGVLPPDQIVAEQFAGVFTFIRLVPSRAPVEIEMDWFLRVDDVSRPVPFYVVETDRLPRRSNPRVLETIEQYTGWRFVPRAESQMYPQRLSILDTITIQPGKYAGTRTFRLRLPRLPEVLGFVFQTLPEFWQVLEDQPIPFIGADLDRFKYRVIETPKEPPEERTRTWIARQVLARNVIR